MKIRSLAAALLALVLPTGPLAAHHAFAAEFDRDQPITITGTVTKVEWMNPHARIYLDAPDSERDDQVFNWNLELGGASVLMRRGWRRDTLVPGDTITVEGWRARNAPHVGNARSVTLADGAQVFAESSADQ